MRLLKPAEKRRSARSRKVLKFHLQSLASLGIGLARFARSAPWWVRNSASTTGTQIPRRTNERRAPYKGRIHVRDFHFITNNHRREFKPAPEQK